MEFKFVGTRELAEEHFKQHPIWLLYEDPEQGEEISTWGVDLEKAWSERIENPENEYYFPYLGIEEPALVRGTQIYCEVKTKNGMELNGVLIGSFAFSLFVSGEKYLFNRNLLEFGKKASEKLCSAIGAKEESIFPLTFTPRARCFAGKSTSHSKYW